MSPLASSIFTPAIDQMEEEFDTDKTVVVGGTTGFVVMLGIGPLILAPLSETFGMCVFPVFLETVLLDFESG